MVGVGGTATTLASVEQGLEEFIFDRIHHFILKKEALKKQIDLYRSRTIEERTKIPGLPSKRADIILAGAAIFYWTVEELKCPSILISGHGVRYGLLYKKISDGRLQISD
jgi:exopolyphosphatase/guanosine-5'-triphosphate,3'-diphosphate pyrophosphatase